MPPPQPDDPATAEKRLMFAAFVAILVAIASGGLLVRNLFLTVTGRNVLTPGDNPIGLGMITDLPWIAGAFVLALAAACPLRP